MKRFISNYDTLATTALRKDALDIVESAYQAIDTEEAIKKRCFLNESTLSVGGHCYNLTSYEHIYLIGFGKASCLAVATLEEILKGHVSEGVVIDKSVGVCQISKVYQGEHPKPTAHNVEVSSHVADLAVKATEKDLVIVVVSGGGSSLLCWPLSECEQSAKLYEVFLKTGGTISELNTLRKHISSVKGGGLAKLLYPATVVSLIFSDVPGDAYENVASGPTYKDTTTIQDAEEILKKYSLENQFTFMETPKEDMYFQKITNVPIVSNLHAIEGMKKKAESLGYQVSVLSTDEYREASLVLKDMKEALQEKTVVLVAGEPSVIVDHPGDNGGRNEYAACKALSIIEENEVCIPFASDGIDNRSVSAGALVDHDVVRFAEVQNISIASYLNEGKHDELCIALQNQIITGATGSNVSDCIMYLRA
jgi:glycerate-2-kinase